jgi:integrase
MPCLLRIDLTTVAISALELPSRGELIIRDSVACDLALRLRSTGARSWVHFARADGKSTRRTLGQALTIPVEVARRMAVPAEPARPAETAPSHLGLTFHEGVKVDELLSHFLAAGENGRWKASTLRNMQAVARSHILPRLGHRPVREITSEEVARWHLDVTANSSAARMALSTLSGLMLYAEDHGLREVGSNPCKGLRKKQRGQRGRALPADTMRRLWTALDRLQECLPVTCDVVRLLILTGARRSEVLAFKWERIAGPRAVLEDSKSGPRTIWLNAPARAILDARMVPGSSGLVFPARRAKGPTTTLDHDWAIIRKEAGIGSLRLHDLRHHFASAGVSNGIDLRIIGQLLGHHDLDSTLVYAHLTSASLSRSATRVSGVIDRALRGQVTATRTPRKRTARTGRNLRTREATNA